MSIVLEMGDAAAFHEWQMGPPKLFIDPEIIRAEEYRKGHAGQTEPDHVRRVLRRAMDDQIRSARKLTEEVADAKGKLRALENSLNHVLAELKAVTDALEGGG